MKLPRYLSDISNLYKTSKYILLQQVKPCRKTIYEKEEAGYTAHI